MEESFVMIYFSDLFFFLGSAPNEWPWWKVSAVQPVGYVCSCSIVQRVKVLGPFPGTDRGQEALFWRCMRPWQGATSLPRAWNLTGNWIGYVWLLVGPVVFGRWPYHIQGTRVRWVHLFPEVSNWNAAGISWSRRTLCYCPDVYVQCLSDLASCLS